MERRRKRYCHYCWKGRGRYRHDRKTSCYRELREGQKQKGGVVVGRRGMLKGIVACCLNTTQLRVTNVSSDE